MTRYQGGVAAGHSSTAGAAEAILQAGGNAFDAAIGAFFCACVAEPVLASTGGGGFALAHPHEGSARIIDFFTHTPLAAVPRDALDIEAIEVDFGATQQIFHIGLGTVAVPGCVKGMFHLHRQLGHMPMNDIVQPALEAARQGVDVNQHQSIIFDAVAPIYQSRQTYRTQFSGQEDKDGEIRPGDRLTMPEFADVLETLALEGDDFFYRGEIAALATELTASKGGAIGRDDLASYAVLERQPLRLPFRNARVSTNALPSPGGALIGFGLQLLDRALGERQHLSISDRRVLVADALVATETARHELEAGDGDIATLTGDHMIARYAARLSNVPTVTRGTTHFNIIDRKGNGVAISVSNGEGCGEVIPGTGIMLNNMLGEEDLNRAGIGSWTCNQRMGSMMAPTFIELGRDRQAWLGSGGSNRIRSAILQVIVNYVEGGMDIESAVLQPRMHYEKDHLFYEMAGEESLDDALLSRFDDSTAFESSSFFFGGVHALVRDAGGIHGIGDPRRGGCFVAIGT